MRCEIWVYIYLSHSLIRRNELLGLEGMVKLKNPDDPVVVVVNVPAANGTTAAVTADPNVSASVSFENEKRYGRDWRPVTVDWLLIVRLPDLGSAMHRIAVCRTFRCRSQFQPAARWAPS